MNLKGRGHFERGRTRDVRSNNVISNGVMLILNMCNIIQEMSYAELHRGNNFAYE